MHRLAPISFRIRIEWLSKNFSVTYAFPLNQMNLTWQDLISLLKPESFETAFELVLSVCRRKLNQQERNNIRTPLANCKKLLRRRWMQCNRCTKTFQQRHSAWLDREIPVPTSYIEQAIPASAAPIQMLSSIPSTSQSIITSTPKCSKSRTYRRVKHISDTIKSPSLLYKATYRACRKRSTPRSIGVAKIVRSATKTPTSYKKILTAIQNSHKYSQQRVLTTKESLGLLLEHFLTKHQYNVIRKATSLAGPNVFPP